MFGDKSSSKIGRDGGSRWCFWRLFREVSDTRISVQKKGRCVILCPENFVSQENSSSITDERKHARTEHDTNCSLHGKEKYHSPPFATIILSREFTAALRIHSFIIIFISYQIMRIVAAPVLTLLFAHRAVVEAMEYMNEIKVMDGHTKKHHVVSPLPHT